MVKKSTNKSERFYESDSDRKLTTKEDEKINSVKYNTSRNLSKSRENYSPVSL